MKNKDAIKLQKAAIFQAMSAAVANNDQEAYEKALNDLCELIQEGVMEDARQLVGETDSQILMSRGVRQLTSDEKKYYEKLIEAMRSDDPRQAVNAIDVVMPETVIDQVFEDLRANHPLLSKISFQSLKGITRMMMNTHGYQKAAWGKLCSKIVQEITSGFKEVEFGQNKLSAFLPICKAMLDLGPNWLDRYIREILYEAIANGLEDGIINGTGKDMPVGMIRHVGDDVSVVSGVYPEKEPIKITRLDNVQMGAVASVLTINGKGHTRPLKDLIMIVNPQDYYSRVMPAVQYQAPGGGYVSAKPFDFDIVESSEVKPGTAIFGSAKLYMMGGGIGNKGKILYSDEYHFLEDERVYLIKLYAHGFPIDNNSFVVLDITDLQPAAYRVENVTAPAEVDNATLANLSVGGIKLTPEFDPATTTYTVTTEDEMNAVAFMPAKATARATVKYNNKLIANGEMITWAAGSGNTLKIEVKDGAATKTYNVTVTKA